MTRVFVLKAGTHCEREIELKGNLAINGFSDSGRKRRDGQERLQSGVMRMIIWVIIFLIIINIHF